jgi:hypothetical protein
MWWQSCGKKVVENGKKVVKYETTLFVSYVFDRVGISCN